MFKKLLLTGLILVLISSLGITAAPLTKYKGMSWSVGQWTEYKMTIEKETINVRYSITGSEVISGKTYYWFEMSSQNQRIKSVTKMLITPGEKPKKFYMKSGDRPAMDMTSMMNSNMHKNQKPPVHTDDTINAGIVGVGPVVVPGGTFVAVHSRIKDDTAKINSDIWVSDKVPVTGIVKSTGGDSESTVTMQLQKYGTTGAKTEITETPKPFVMPNMQNMRNMPGGRPKGNE